MPDKKFLETYPLYRRLTTPFLNKPLYKIPLPAIHMHCDTCNSEQTFNMINEYHELESSQSNIVKDQVVRARYLCSACRTGERLFFIKFSHETLENKKKEEQLCICMRKVGQYPSWSIEPDRNLEKLLGEHAKYYKNGLICESQSYGIGAYAYFRRITEDIIGSLLDSICDLVEPSEKEKYQKALKEVEKTRVTKDKIELVQDLLPQSLQPDGMNPLNILHSALSKGLHGKTDEECMEQAEMIRESLVFLVEQILRAKEGSKKFTANMKKLLEKEKKG